MTAQEYLANLLEGTEIPDDEKNRLFGLVESNKKFAENVTTRFSQAQEAEQLRKRQAELQAELDGNETQPGTRAYQKWYNEHYRKIQELQTNFARYQERFGPLDETGSASNNGTASNNGGQMTKEEIEQALENRINNVGAKMTDYLKQTGSILERHIRAGRKRTLEMDKLVQLAVEKHGGSLERAYDEWDQPEALEVSKAQQEAEIKRRVEEELAKRQSAMFVPGSGDGSFGTPRSSGPLTRSVGVQKPGEAPVYNREKVIQAAVTGKY